jgi:hypothetical protein
VRRFISRAVSCWIASRVFFLFRQRVRFRWPHLTDLGVDLQELFVQGLVLAEFADFPLGLAHGGPIGQRLGDGLALSFVGETGVGTVAWLVGLMAMAVGLAATAGGGSDGTATQVAEGGDLIGDLDAALGERFQGLGHHH